MAQLPLPSQSVVFLLLSLCHSCRVGQTISRDPDPKNLCPLGFRKICTELVSKQSRSRFGIALFCTHCSLECVRLSGIDQSIWRSAHQKEPPSPSSNARPRPIPWHILFISGSWKAVDTSTTTINIFRSQPEVVVQPQKYCFRSSEDLHSLIHNVYL